MMSHIMRFGQSRFSCADCLTPWPRRDARFRQRPRQPHPHEEKMPVLHGFERTAASIHMAAAEALKIFPTYRFQALNKRDSDRAPLAGGAERPIFQHRVLRRGHRAHRAWRHRPESCFLNTPVCRVSGRFAREARLCVLRGLAFKLCVEKAVSPPHGPKKRVQAGRAASPCPRVSMVKLPRTAPLTGDADMRVPARSWHYQHGHHQHGHWGRLS